MGVIKINNIVYGSNNSADIIYKNTTVEEKLNSIPVFDPSDNANIEGAKYDYLTYGHIVDALNSSDTSKVLSANQGRVLSDKIDNIDLSHLEDGIAVNAENITTLNNKVPFSFGVDANGNYGYIKDGADTVTPFKNIEIETGAISIKYTSNSWIYVTVTFKTPFKTNPQVFYSYSAGSTGGSVFISSISTTSIKFGYNNFLSGYNGTADKISWVAYTI